MTDHTRTPVFQSELNRLKQLRDKPVFRYVPAPGGNIARQINQKMNAYNEQRMAFIEKRLAPLKGTVKKEFAYAKTPQHSQFKKTKPPVERDNSRPQKQDHAADKSKRLNPEKDRAAFIKQRTNEAQGRAQRDFSHAAGPTPTR